jgi:hypothetical protein
MNDEHDATKILGHIVDSRVLDKSGNEIASAENDSIPDEFDIEVAGVLYRAFPELSDRIDEIITKANAGEMFVSMEAWFPDFGYGLIDPATGETKLIERNESTAFLTKHLRIYGGCGQYQGYKVGRVLRDIIFGAQGFVEQPANPDSVIKVAASKVAPSNVFVTAELNEILEGGVEDVNEDQVKELQAKLDEALASLATKETKVSELQKAADEFKAADYDSQIAALNDKVDGLTNSMTEVSEKAEAGETAKAELQKQLDEVTQRAEKSEAELDDIRKTETARERLAKISEIKKVEDEEATLADLRGMTPETFDAVLKYAGETKAEEVKPEDEAKAADESKKEKDAEADQATANLDDVKEIESADFNASEDAKKTEAKAWESTAASLLGRNEQD